MELRGTELVKQYTNSVSNSPLVSVIVNTYNHEKYIGKCIESIVSQSTDFAFELLLGEDNSTDETRNICIAYAEKYPDKIRLFLHSRENNIKINGNPTGRYNLLYSMKNSRGKYMALCSGDDYWIDEKKLEKQVGFLEKNPDYSFSCGRVRVQDEVSGKVYDRPEPPFVFKKEYLDISHYIKFSLSQTSSFLFRNNLVLSEWFKEISAGDKAIALLAIGGNKIKFHKDFFSIYRDHPAGRSKAYHKNPRKIYDNEKQMWTLFKKHCIPAEYSKLIRLRIIDAYLLYKTLDAKWFFPRFFYRALKKTLMEIRKRI